LISPNLKVYSEVGLSTAYSFDEGCTTRKTVLKRENGGVSLILSRL